MAVIEKRVHVGQDRTQKTVYRAKVRLREGTASKTFDRKSAAVEWAAQTEREMREGVYIERNRARTHTLSEALDKYLAGEDFAQLADKKHRATHIAWWRAKFGDTRLSELGRELAGVREILRMPARESAAPRRP